MKKIIFLLFISISFAQTTTQTDFFYSRGYEEGFNRGFEEGVNAAFKSAKEVWMKYKNEIDAYEIGKYLIASKRLTYPEVWQSTDSDGNIKLNIQCSKIDSKLDIDEIFTRFAEIPQKPNKVQNQLTLTSEEQHSRVNVNRDITELGLPTNINDVMNISRVQIEINDKNRELLSKSNIAFSEQDDYYIALFFTAKEKEIFCQTYKICGNEQESTTTKIENNDINTTTEE